MVFFSFLSWFRPWWKSSETDYETVLSRLSKDITSVQTRLVRVNQRERRASVTLTLYAVLLWLLYAIGLWYWSADKRLEMSKGERFKLWSPVLLGLIFIISTRSLVRWWYARIARGEETHLRSLQRTRRKKIDEIKQATRYDHLRSLLEKYDDTAPTKASMTESNRPRTKARGSSRNVVPSVGSSSAQNGTAVSNATSTGPSLAINDVAVGAQDKPAAKEGIVMNAGEGSSSMTNPTLSLRTQTQLPRTWLDRVADKILGAEAGGQHIAAEQRYALICQICFTHNGLCPKEEWEEVQYICPRCGTFNSRRPSSIPVSKPWASPSPGRRSSESLTPASHSPSPSTRARSPASLASFETKEERTGADHGDEGQENDMTEEHPKHDLLRSRKSALAMNGALGLSGGDLEDMEVD